MVYVAAGGGGGGVCVSNSNGYRFVPSTESYLAVRSASVRELFPLSGRWILILPVPFLTLWRGDSFPGRFVYILEESARYGEENEFCVTFKSRENQTLAVASILAG